MIRILFILLLCASAATAADKPQTLQDLLAEIQAGHTNDRRLAEERETRFLANQSRQKAELQRVEESITRAEAKSLRLEKKFRENETRLAELQALLNERLGVLGALFGQLRLSAAQMVGQIETSLISGEYKNRTPPLQKIADSTKLPAIEELEILWHRLHEEMTAQGEAKYFEGKVVDSDGTAEIQTILRIGGFIAIGEEGLLRYNEAGHFSVPPRQPSSRFVSVAEDIYEDDEEISLALIDPSRGGLLDVLVQLPTMGERLAQGGIIGTLIILLGMIGFVLGAGRFWYLYKENQIITAQLEGEENSPPNALLRVLAAARDDTDSDAIETKLDDAILQELPALEKHLSIVKLLAAVAPLLGLLGTVTGMILTFEAIARFGTGDPKLMADGISQALMTTVLGLLVAIPLLGLHALAHNYARRIAHILEEQAAGILAEHITKQDRL